MRKLMLLVLLAVSLASCSGSVDGVDNVTQTSAQIHGSISWAAGDGPGSFYYEVARDDQGSNWANSRRVGEGSYPLLNGGGSVSNNKTVVGLDPGVRYKVRFCGSGNQGDQATICGASLSFTTQTAQVACDATQGSESLAQMISANPAGTAADRRVLCVRGGTQNIGQLPSPKAFQTLRGVSAHTLNGNVNIQQPGVSLVDIHIAGCYGTSGCNANQDKTIHVLANDVTISHSDVTAQGPSRTQSLQCMLIGDQQTRPSGLVVEFSRFHGCGLESTGDHQHGIYCQNTSGPRFEGNWLYDNEGWGFHLYPNCDNALLVGNVNAENGNACALSGEGSTASDNVQFRSGFCGFARQPAGTNSKPIHCFSGGNGSATDMTLYDPDDAGVTNCSSSALLQSNTLRADPQFVSRAGFDFRVQNAAVRARMGSYADSVPGPRW